jgi:hypothetical protein
VEFQSFRIICKAAMLHPCAVLKFSVVPEVLHGKWHLVNTGGLQYWFEANNVKVVYYETNLSCF